MKRKAKLHVLDAEPLGDDVIRTLQDAMDRAVAGEFSSVAIATVYRDGTAGRTWSDAPSAGLLIGSIERLKVALIMSVEE